MRHLLPLFLVFHAAPALSAAFTGKIPGLVSPIARLPLNPSISLPGVNLPATQGGVGLPGKLPPLPVQLPVEVAPAAAPDAAGPAAAFLDDDASYFLRWDLLDGEDDGMAGALVPVAPGPKPLSPAGAMRELVFADEAPAEVFDAGRRTPLLAR